MLVFTDYCSIVNETVNVNYHTVSAPILGLKSASNEKIFIDECSHSEQCNIGSNDCPIFRKLNNI